MPNLNLTRTTSTPYTFPNYQDKNETIKYSFTWGYPIWVTATAYNVGDLIVPTDNTGIVLVCTIPGISGGTEPTWTTELADTVTDGTITWTVSHTYPFLDYAEEIDISEWFVESAGNIYNQWQATTDYALGDIVTATGYTGLGYECTVAGTSDATEPAWPALGDTVDDDSVTWTAIAGTFDVILSAPAATTKKASVLVTLNPTTTEQYFTLINRITNDEATPQIYERSALINLRTL